MIFLMGFCLGINIFTVMYNSVLISQHFPTQWKCVEIILRLFHLPIDQLDNWLHFLRYFIFILFSSPSISPDLNMNPDNSIEKSKSQMHSIRRATVLLFSYISKKLLIIQDNKAFYKNFYKKSIATRIFCILRQVSLILLLDMPIANDVLQSTGV